MIGALRIVSYLSLASCLLAASSVRADEPSRDDQAFAELQKAQVETSALEEQIYQKAKRLAAPFDLGVYQAFSGKMIEGLEMAPPNLRAIGEGERILLADGSPSNYVLRFVEISGQASFYAWHHYFARMAIVWGRRLANIEKLSIKSLPGEKVELVAIYAVPHPAPIERQVSGRTPQEVAAEMVLANTRRRLFLQRLDELAAKAHARSAIDALAALSYDPQAKEMVVYAADFDGDVHLEGGLREKADAGDIEKVFSRAGFSRVKVELGTPGPPCRPFSANMVLGATREIADVDSYNGNFGSLDQCRPPAPGKSQ